MLVLGSPRPVTHYCGSVLSSKECDCLALGAAIFLVAASPAAAEDTDPVPAPTLPAPDPAPPAPGPKPSRPAPVKKPAAKPAPAHVAPAVAPAIVAPAPQTEPVRSAPVRAKTGVRKKHVVVTTPAEPLRHPPIRDASAPRVDETALVLTAARIGEDDVGVGRIAVVALFWLALAAALLIVAYVAPFADVPGPGRVFLYERRGVLALIGVNMVAAAAICYLVVGIG